MPLHSSELLQQSLTGQSLTLCEKLPLYVANYFICTGGMSLGRILLHVRGNQAFPPIYLRFLVFSTLFCQYMQIRTVY